MGNNGVEDSVLSEKGKTALSSETCQKAGGGGTKNPDSVSPESSENTDDIKEKAKKKLEDELKNAKDNSFAAWVIEYLVKRCEEDKGLSEDVLQEHKTWEKCFAYIFTQARKQSKGNCAAVRDEVVYEWAEDYYHKEDKAEEAQKAPKAAERAARAKERAAKAKERAARAKENKSKSKAEEKTAQEKRSGRSGRDLEGQMDLFSMMEM